MDDNKYPEFSKKEKTLLINSWHGLNPKCLMQSINMMSWYQSMLNCMRYVILKSERNVSRRNYIKHTRTAIGHCNRYCHLWPVTSGTNDDCKRLV